MKILSITSIAGLVLVNVGLVWADRDENGLRSPQCVQDLIRSQFDLLQHFNGIFGTFSATKYTDKTSKASIYGPIAALNINSTGYDFNTNSEINCEDSNRISRLGFIAKNAYVNGDIYGEILNEEGKINTSQNRQCEVDSINRAVTKPDDLSSSLWSFAPSSIIKTSSKLASFEPDTFMNNDKDLVSKSDLRSYKGYRILKLPACSDELCNLFIANREITTSVLKSKAITLNTPFQNILPTEMIVFNIPVFVNKTFTITTLDVNRNISPCQAIFNFYPVDKSGAYDSNPASTFTLVRAPGVKMAGTILAPQANIIDASTGYFGGQLITLKHYEGHGADIKDFKSVTNGVCSSRSICWPNDVTNAVVEVVHVSTSKTLVSTVTEVINQSGSSQFGTITITNNVATVTATRN